MQMRANASSRHAKDKLSIGVQIKTPKPNKGEKQITPNKHAKRQGPERLGFFFSRQPESDDSVAPVEESGNGLRPAACQRDGKRMWPHISIHKAQSTGALLWPSHPVRECCTQMVSKSTRALSAGDASASSGPA